MLDKAIWRPAWWLDPARLLVFVVLPIFLVVANFGPYGFVYYKNFADNISASVIFLGVGSILAFAAGALVGGTFTPSPNRQAFIDPSRATNALRVLGVVSIAAYLILLRPFFEDRELVFALLSGSIQAMYEARDAAQRLPGITSFMQVAVVFCSLLAALRLYPNYRLPIDLRLMFVALICCVFFRVLLVSERLAVIEFFVALFLTPIAFRWRPSALRAAAPLWAIIGLVFVFALGEYFRSWQFYKYQGYDSFLQFVLLRFNGYFSTSINNAAGIMLHFDPIGSPANIARWFYKLLQVFGAAPSDPTAITEQYLGAFANPEFNNVSGLYLPFIDLGLVRGLLVLFITGVISGVLYRSFTRLNPAGLIIYPTWYVGLLDLIRIFYWGESRFIPIIVPAVCVALFVRASTIKQPSDSAQGQLASQLSPKA